MRSMRSMKPLLRTAMPPPPQLPHCTARPTRPWPCSQRMICRQPSQPGKPGKRCEFCRSLLINCYLGVVGPGIQGAVGGGVAGLPRGAAEGGQGGEELQHRQRVWGGAGQQVLRAVHLACRKSKAGASLVMEDV